MKRAIDSTVSLTVIGTLQLPESKTACVFHVPEDFASSLLREGTLWESSSGREFVIQSGRAGTNCRNHLGKQIFIAFEALDGGGPPAAGEILYRSTWKYGLNPSRTVLESRLDFVEKIFRQLGAVITDLNKEREEKFCERPIFKRGKDYFRVDVIPFDGKPCIVIEWTDNEQYAVAGALEDVDPFPYDLTDEEIIHEVKLAFEEDVTPAIIAL